MYCQFVLLNSTDRVKTYPTDSEQGVIGSNLLGPFVTTSTVGSENDETSSEGDTGHSKDELLRPGIGVLGPGRHPALVRQGPGGVEDGEGCREHAENDERAAEVDTAKGKLGHTNTGLDFLLACK